MQPGSGGYVLAPEIKKAIPYGPEAVQKAMDHLIEASDPNAVTVSPTGEGVVQDNAMGLLQRSGQSTFFLKNRRHGALIVLRSATYNDVVKAYDMAEWEIREPDKG